MSGTPHMTGRVDSDSTGQVRSASDLLDDDGNVDRSEIASITNGTADRSDRVQASEATEIRQRLFRGESVAAIAKDLDRGSSTVRSHAKGDREYPRDETP